MRALLPALAALSLAAAPLAAQIVVVPLDPATPDSGLPAEPPSGGGFYDPNAVLQQVDHNEGWMPLPDPLNPGEVLPGTVEELTLGIGETAGLGWLQITLGDCRYPVDNPSGDAYAWLVIREEAGAAPVFEGWMIASSPGLNALDHARFDVWVLGCTGAEAAAEASPEAAAEGSDAAAGQ